MMIIQELKNGNWSVLARLPKNAQILLLAIIAVITAVILTYGYIIFTEKSTRFDALLAEEKTLLDKLDTLQRVKNSIKLYEKQKVEAESVLQEVSKRLPQASELIEFNKNLDAIAQKNGVVVLNYRRGVSETAQNFVKSHPIELNGCASYHNFVRFLADLSSLDRIITLEKLSLTNNRVGQKATSTQGIDCSKFGLNVFPFSATLASYQYIK